MIISREFVPFRRLVECGDKGGILFQKLCKKVYPEDMVEEAYRFLLDRSLYQREMEWGFRGIGELIEGFRKLDEKEPYDNGYSFDDVWGSELYRKYDDKAIILLLTGMDEKSEVVRVIEIDRENVEKTENH